MKRTQPTAIRSGSKARVIYDRAHVAWRSGAITSWYYGRRSPNDSTIIWLIDRCEYEGKDLAGVAAALDAAFMRAGIAAATFGAAWCGYRSLLVIYADGSRLTQRYDAATGRVVREQEMAERAGSAVEVAA
jgi:hypothetical protein